MNPEVYRDAAILIAEDEADYSCFAITHAGQALGNVSSRTCIGDGTYVKKYEREFKPKDMLCSLAWYAHPSYFRNINYTEKLEARDKLARTLGLLLMAELVESGEVDG